MKKFSFFALLKILVLVLLCVIAVMAARDVFFPGMWMFLDVIPLGGYIFGLCMAILLLLILNPRKEIYEMSLAPQKQIAGGWYWGGLVVLIVAFCAVKVPFMEQDFATKYYGNKYPSYIQPAQHMVEEGPWVYKKEYLKGSNGNVFEQGISYRTFSAYPVMEWTLAGVKILLPNQSREFVARLVMMFWGVVMLISLVVFLQHFLPRKMILFVVFLVVASPLFQYMTFLTILDPLVLIVLFWSLHILIRGIETENISLLYLTGLLAGIGINIKYHAILFYVPLFVMLICFWKKLSSEKKLAYTMLILPNFVLQTALFWGSVRYIPSNPSLFLSLFGVMFVIQILLYRWSHRIYAALLRIIKMYGWKRILGILLGVSVLGIIAVFFVPQFSRMVSEFLTDKYLIFNGSIYQTILFSYQINLGLFLLILFFVLFFISFVLPLSKQYKLLISVFFLSSILYGILASKILYNHLYYHHIFVLLAFFSLSILVVVVAIYRYIWTKLLFLVSFICIVILCGYSGFLTLIGNHNETYLQVGSFIQSRSLLEAPFLMYGNFGGVISLYAQRTPLYVENSIVFEQFLSDFSVGLSLYDVAQKYHISYLVSCSDGNYLQKWFYDLYHTIPLSSFSIPEKTRFLLCKMDNMYCDTFADYASVSPEHRAFFATTVMPHLALEEKIGECSIYRFVK